MIRMGRIFCDFCNLEIGMQRFKAARRHLPDGRVRQVHYHNRDSTDCYVKEIARLQSLLKKEAV